MKESEKDDFDDIPVVDISKVLSLSEKQKLKSTEWAEIIDVSSSLENFNDLVPNPAFTWPFELDRFQKHVRNTDRARQECCFNSTKLLIESPFERLLFILRKVRMYL